MSKKDLVLDAFVKNANEIPEDYIDRYRKLQSLEGVLQGKLLGNFEKGEYVIPKEIKEELVKIKKVVCEWTANGLKATSKVHGTEFNFEVEVKDFDDNQMIAALFIVEKFFDKELKTFVVDFVGAKGPFFRDEAMIVFHIEVDGDSEDKDAYESISERLEKLKKLNSVERDFVIEMYSELYVLRMLKLLKLCGPLGEKILREYAEQIKALGYDKGISTDFYIKLRRVLDGVIERNGGLATLVKQNPQIKLPLKEFVDAVELYEKAAQIEAKPEKKKESSKPVKTEEKSSGGDKKKSGGDKKKDKGGSKPAKKDAKKDKKVIKGRFVPEKKAEAPIEEVKPIKKSDEVVAQKSFNEEDDMLDRVFSMKETEGKDEDKVIDKLTKEKSDDPIEIALESEIEPSEPITDSGMVDENIEGSVEAVGHDDTIIDKKLRKERGTEIDL